MTKSEEKFTTPSFLGSEKTKKKREKRNCCARGMEGGELVWAEDAS